jgi:hypothetical protein
MLELSFIHKTNIQNVEQQGFAIAAAAHGRQRASST